jgi:hypothetical protein
MFNSILNIGVRNGSHKTTVGGKETQAVIAMNILKMVRIGISINIKITLVNTIFVTSKLFSVSTIIFYDELKNATRMFLSPITFFVTSMYNIANSANYFFNVRIQKHTHKHV